MARPVLVVLVAVVLGVLLVLWLGRPSRQPPAPAPAQAAPAASQPADAGPRSLRQRAAIRLVQPAPAGPTAPAPSGAIEGRVVSAITGRGLAAAQLTFSSGQGAASVAAGADGRFRFDAPRAGRWWLAAVTAPEHQPFAPEWGQSPVQLDLRPGEVVQGVVVALLPAEPYQGRVVGEKDEPLEGALVTVLGGGLGQTTLVPLGEPARTGPDGTFRFDAPEDAVLEVRRPGFATGRARVDYAVRIARTIVVRLASIAGTAPALAIDGLVEDAAGLPAEGAAVSASSRRDPGSPPALARADAQGRFRLADLAPGAWALTASLPGAEPAHAEAEAGATGLRLRLGVGGRLVGRVRDRERGGPVPLFTVIVLGAAPRTAAVVDGEGRFELGGLAPGEALVSVLAPGYAPSPELRTTIPAAGSAPAHLEVELTRGGRITGQVVERGAGTPLAGARVEVEGTPSSNGVPIRNETLTDDDGRFGLDAVGGGPVSLFASATGHHARVLAAPPVRDGETVGPVLVELGALRPGEEPRVELVGIGAALEKVGEVLRITRVVPTGGAAEAGLGPGDEILAIDGVPVRGMSLADAIPRIRGPEGSTVTVVVAKAGDATRTGVPVVVPRRLVRG